MSFYDAVIAVIMFCIGALVVIFTTSFAAGVI